MTKDDLANLVVRAIALWLGATGVTTLASLPFLPGRMGVQVDASVIAVFAVPLAAGVLLWVVAPHLARAIFQGSDDQVRFELTAKDVPALASFVIGLFMCAEAVPQLLGLFGFVIMRARTDTSLMSGSSIDIDAQGMQRAIGFGARLVVGIALIANCRRFSIGPREDVNDADVPSMDGP